MRNTHMMTTTAAVNDWLTRAVWWVVMISGLSDWRIQLNHWHFSGGEGDTVGFYLSL